MAEKEAQCRIAEAAEKSRQQAEQIRQTAEARLSEAAELVVQTLLRSL